MPAERSASSNDVSFSRCFPTPLVKNISLGTNPTTSRSLSPLAHHGPQGNLHGKHGDCHCQQTIRRFPRPAAAEPAFLTRAAAGDKLGQLTISSTNMNRTQARESARDLLEIVPLVMRTLAAELRAAGELPAPAHFALLALLAERPRSLSELASLRGVSLPTMSNSVTSLVERGWIRRSAPERDRRIVLLDVTPSGRAALERVSRSAEAHIADVLAPLDGASRRRLQAGLAVLRKVFAPPPNGHRQRPPRAGGSPNDRK
jgi:DNA-binding MarR family transcriptional regulator